MVKVVIAALLLFVAPLEQRTHGGEPLLLNFTSPNCGPCQQMVPTIQDLAAAGYPVRRVDVTQEPKLATQFRVTQVPCSVMLVDGREVNRILGAASRSQLESMLQQAGGVAANAADGRVRTQSPDAVPRNDPWSGVAIGNDAAQGHADSTVRNQAGVLPLESQLIGASVRLRVEDSAGRSYGTGTIIDTRSGEALVITCGHLFRESKGQGPVIVEVFAATPEGVRVVEQLPGQVISYNLDRDLGLVSIRPTRSARVAAIAPTQTVIERGHRVTSVGCDHGRDPTALATRVTAVNRYQGPPNIEASGAPVEGRSGGGLFDAEGRLVGVCFAADYEGNEGLYTALESIHDELDRLGLSEIYQSQGDTPAHDDLAVSTTTATPPVIRGQEPMQPVMPLADQPQVTPATPDAAFVVDDGGTAPGNLNPVERAAWDEIMARAADSEVICIIRPKQAGGKSEIIALDGMSPEFVRALAERSNAAAAMTR